MKCVNLGVEPESTWSDKEDMQDQAKSGIKLSQGIDVNSHVFWI